MSIIRVVHDHGLAMHATTIAISSHDFAIAVALPVSLHELTLGHRTVIRCV